MEESEREERVQKKDKKRGRERENEKFDPIIAIQVPSWTRNKRDNIVVYVILVKTNSTEWMMEKRYSEFRELYLAYASSIQTRPSFRFPARRLYHPDDVLNYRQKAFETFLADLNRSEFPELNHFLQVVEHTGVPVECCHLGVKYLDKKLGSGLPASKGDHVRIHYVGKLQLNNEIFDRTLKKDGPFEFQLGEKEVIAGWEIGIVGMRMGGTRYLTIPPEKAYGKRGVPPDIPPNATLLFEVNMVEVLRDSFSSRRSFY